MAVDHGDDEHEAHRPAGSPGDEHGDQRRRRGRTAPRSPGSRSAALRDGPPNRSAYDDPSARKCQLATSRPAATMSPRVVASRCRDQHPADGDDGQDVTSAGGSSRRARRRQNAGEREPPGGDDLVEDQRSDQHARQGEEQRDAEVAAADLRRCRDGTRRRRRRPARGARRGPADRSMPCGPVHRANGAVSSIVDDSTRSRVHERLRQPGDSNRPAD